MKKILLHLGLMVCLLINYSMSAKAQTYVTSFDNYWNSNEPTYYGKVLVRVGCGNSTLYTYQKGYSLDTLLHVQSLSKLVTASIIMMLEEENKLELDSAVGKYIPSWKNNGKGGITIRQLLSHTSGLVEETGWENDSTISLETAVNNIATSTLLFQPGQGFKYGNTAYKVAARVAEVVENKAWKTIFAERVKNPLGMPSAVYSPKNIDNPAGGSGLHCSLNDYSAFMKMMLNYGMHGSTRIMDSVSIVEMEKYQSGPSAYETYGFGQYREEIVNGVAKEFYHPGVSGCLEFYNRNKNYYGVILSQTEFNSTYSINQAFRTKVRNELPSNACSGGSTPQCDFNVTASASPTSVNTNGSITLTASCTGADCSGVTYAWSGNGASGSGSPLTITAPSTAGNYTYTVTASKSGCSNKTANTQPVTVTNPSSGSGCVVNKVKFQFRQTGECCMDRLQGAKIQGSNNGTTWTDLLTFTTNGTGSWQEFPISNTTAYSSVRFVASSTGWGELYELEFYNGSTKLTGTPFGIGNYANAFDGNLSTDWQVSSNPGSNNYAGLNLTGCSTTTNCDFNVTASASPTSVNTNGSVTLTASCTGADCSGVTYAWSGNGASGSGSPLTITAPSTAGTYTYTVTASKSGCSNKTANTQPVTVTNPSGGSGCVVNKVKFQFRQTGECCMDRLQGAKIQGSNNGSTWTDLLTFTTNGTGSWQEFPISNTTAYSSVRFVASSTGWGELYELEFYNGSTKLSGTPFGIGNYANAFDGNILTDWQVSSNPGSNNYAGLSNLGNCSGSPAMLEQDIDPSLANSKGIQVAPNPSQGVFDASFYLERGKKATLVVSDMLGRTILRRQVTGQGLHKEKINLGNKAPGTLLLQLHKDGKIETKKINIAR